MPKKRIPLKIELTGTATESAEDSLTMLIEVLRTIARDFGITIDYPAMIYLDDLEPTPDPPGAGKAQ
ncbi:MAG: hypothetical protein DPW09_29405 [Anaerolineae bacterium]|nr:hypothetical protein [Anaerolineales bacterium]MCQ3977566.1 hypothetical protein [Anaerolineae bacterium]